MRSALLVAALLLAALATLTPAAAAEPDAAPCTVSPPAHVGFDCTVGRIHCAFHIWVDLNPPNPTWDCLG